MGAAAPLAAARTARAAHTNGASRTDRAARALAGAAPRPFWTDDRAAPSALPALAGPERADLLVVGGGFSGLWTALLAKESDPGRDVVLVEADTCGWAATGRNGGFCVASLTHGHANGARRFPDEIDRLDQLGRDNLDAIASTLHRHGIDAEWERTGELDVAVAPWQVDDLRAGYEAHTTGVEWMDTDVIRAEVHSPTYLAGVWDRRSCAMVNPSRLAWGLRRACLDLGVRIYERTAVTDLARSGGSMVAATDLGSVRADRVALATNIFPPLLRRIRSFVVPVYDHVLMTEPLSAAQLESIGWSRRQGIGDSGNRFHYYRLSADNRILWGGYDAIYHAGGRVRSEYDHNPATYLRLSEQFFDTFPQLEGLRFTHRWGGAIDTCSRFCAFFGTAHRGRVAYATGYTGLGVGATRFGAQVMLDLLSGTETELTGLRMVRSKPIPFPPEPLASAVIQATRWSLARADDREGRRNLWLRALDAIGAGFDS